VGLAARSSAHLQKSIKDSAQFVDISGLQELQHRVAIVLGHTHTTGGAKTRTLSLLMMVVIQNDLGLLALTRVGALDHLGHLILCALDAIEEAKGQEGLQGQGQAIPILRLINILDDPSTGGIIPSSDQNVDYHIHAHLQEHIVALRILGLLSAQRFHRGLLERGQLGATCLHASQKQISQILGSQTSDIGDSWGPHRRTLGTGGLIRSAIAGIIRFQEQ